ncbi:hypothetical protein ACFQ1I_17930 [Kitasatospora arboriphila]
MKRLIPTSSSRIPAPTNCPAVNRDLKPPNGSSPISSRAMKATARITASTDLRPCSLQ